MSQMEQFHTRARANEGKRLQLFAPDGRPTEHWLQVRHVYSDAFQQANEAALDGLRDALLAAGGDGAAVADIKRDAQTRALAALVSAWSFDAECTPEAVADFLREAPQIAAKLDTFAADGRRFFGNDSTSSDAGSSQNAS